jgi:diguanylate cyclase (GGDEF)-like protein
LDQAPRPSPERVARGDNIARLDERLSQLSGYLPFKSSGWKVFLVAVLVCGLAVSATLSSLWYGYVSSQRRQAVVSSLGNVRSILGTSLERDNDLLTTVNALVATHPQLTNRSLTAVLSRLGLSQYYPGSVAFAYLERVSAAGLKSFEAVADRDPPLGLPNSGRVWKSQGGTADYCLPRLADVQGLPQDAFLKRLLVAWAGPYLSPRFNYCASASFARSLETSASTGRPAVASVSTLLRKNPVVSTPPGELHALVSQLPVFIEVSPVYLGPEPPTTPGRRLEALAGWTMGIFDATEILKPALANESGVCLVLEYAPPGAPPSFLAEGGHPQTGVAMRKLSVPADPGWVIRAAVNPRGGGPSPKLQALTMLLVALALTFLFVFLLSLLVRSRRSALELVEDRTAELRHQALHDSLTGLPNRFLVNQRAHELVARTRSDGVSLAVFFIDLDDFKKINDTFGHDAGDELLRAVGARLLGSVRDCDTVGRLGGDEFVVLSEVPEERLARVAARLLEVVREPFSLGTTTKMTLSTSASIGVASGPRSGPDELLRDADIAMYRAKSMGKNCHVIFEPEMHEVVKRQLTLEADLAEAYANREFFLVYQPIVELETGRPRDLEALLRWRHPRRGVVGPGEFISVLESSNLIIGVGRFVLLEACQQLKAWHNRGFRLGMSVNVGALQLHHDVLIDHVREALESTGLDPRYLTLEVTESTLMIDPKTTALRLAALSKLGVRIAIDDFGTGYSSLSYLREFPVDILKIDRSFVAQQVSPGDTNFLDALIHLGKSLGLVTIAEGIEQVSELKHVKHQGCDWGQGFLFSRPLPAEQVEQVIGTGWLRDPDQLAASGPGLLIAPAGWL